MAEHNLEQSGCPTVVRHTQMPCAPQDGIWGVRVPLGDPRLQEPSKWQGRNILGKALMSAREHLRTRESEEPESVAPTGRLRPRGLLSRASCREWGGALTEGETPQTASRLARATDPRG